MFEKHLILNNLWHNYRKCPDTNWSLQSVHLELAHGELLGLLGPSGCGKTTLLRLIAGFERPTQGNISLNGEVISSSSFLLPPEKRGIGMVFQDYALFPHLTVWKNVCFGLKRGDDLNRANWLLELVGIEHLKKRYPHELSGGERQRLALARALAPGNSLVVLDEPFCSLDVEVRYRLRNELSRVLSSCSASALLVTHDPHEALAICDRVAVMKEGKIQQCSTPIEMAKSPNSPFVGQFVFQKNYLSVDINKGEALTSIGPFDFKNNPNNLVPSGLLIDDDALSVTSDPHGKAVVVGREYLGKHWLLIIKHDNQLFRINQEGDKPLKVRERCTISFRSGEKAYIFPGGYEFAFS